MATLSLNADHTATMTLTTLELRTLTQLGDDSLAQYITLWLHHRAAEVLRDQFVRLPDAEQTIMVQAMDALPKPAQTVSGQGIPTTVIP